jgi:outer membrane protein TolC
MALIIKVFSIILILSFQSAFAENNKTYAVSEETITNSTGTSNVLAEDLTQNDLTIDKDKPSSPVTTAISNNQSPLKLVLPINNGNSNNVPMILSLKEAIIRALSNNIEIAVEDFTSKINNEKISQNLSEFDVTLGFDLSLGRKVQQLASAFSSPNKMENDNHNWDFSLSQKLVSGADYKFNFTNNRNKTNSKTAGLNPNYSSEFELSLTQPLLKNFGTNINKRNIFIAKNNVEISDYELNTIVINVISDVENIYWDFVFSLKDLEVKKKSLERAKDLERQIKSQVAVGTMAQIESLQAESDVASREESLLVAQDLIHDNEDKLKNILNFDFTADGGLNAIHPSDQPNFIIEKINFDEAMKKALSTRPDYLAKKKELENKDILVKYQENQIYPSVDLVGSFGVNGLSGKAIDVTSGTFKGRSAYGGSYGTALTDSLSTNFYDWELGLKLSYPIGNRSAKAKLAASRLNKAKQILSMKSLEKKIVLEIRESIRQLKTDAKRIKASQIANKLAKEKLNAEEKKFEVGLSTSFNVLEFQNDLAQAESNQIKSIIDYNQSKVRFRQSIAATLKQHNIELKTNEKI